jgi:hypothetical protein
MEQPDITQSTNTTEIDSIIESIAELTITSAESLVSDAETIPISEIESSSTTIIESKDTKGTNKPIAFYELPPSGVDIVTPPDVEGRINVNRNYVNIFTLRYELSDEILPPNLDLPFSLENKTIRIHRNCTCKYIQRFRMRLVLHLISNRDDTSSNGNIYLLIPNPNDEVIILSRLFGDSYTARQNMYNHMVDGNFDQIDKQVAILARSHAVCHCVHELSIKRYEYNSSVMMIGEHSMMMSLVEALENSSARFSGELFTKCIKMADLKMMAKNDTKSVKHLLRCVLAKIKNTRDDEKYVIVCSTTLDAPLELPGGKREWNPAVSESSSVCAIRELYEECGICITQNAWYKQIGRKSVIIARPKIPHNIFKFYLQPHIKISKLANGLVVLD